MENSVKLVLDKHFPDAGPIKAAGLCNLATIQKATGQNPTKLEESQLSFRGGDLGVLFFVFAFLVWCVLLWFSVNGKMMF